MAASQTAIKRRIDWNDDSDSCHRAFSPPAASLSAVKRPRLDVTQSLQHHDSQSSTRTSPFAPATLNISELIDRPKRPSRAGRICNRCGHESEQMYSISEVQSMVEQAVRSASEQIKLEYDAILHQQLCDQFNTFTKFNQDYISRQIKRSEFSYLS
ncbi:unnamed protein product (mitochondrion) [Plasmodiophora brassicae]|uniref:Uncharacterized protein n=1 Tax=Plasmodiophora brassicae TaxID=37360 RepID=A0A0G4IW66_PLABS|nr:hypothetical protein PBRA_007278 [Plasmodiophora brassicae]SPQ95956.1 unnamed protein product [Plasmodiophora brassicae]